MGEGQGEAEMTTQAPAPRDLEGMSAKKYSYDYWMEGQGVPIHTGYFIDDLRTIEVGNWKLAPKDYDGGLQ